ncbi:penicillin-binding transpeptidase domain-containing protein [Sulfobacillus harzensis]|uniref:PASTA domain-containing protein n=1 Tax=Sulfobacillus harzensis TaxID=2729629 RepID=A0A7Y0L499_9FIRM|nr:penicillin-binding transpeptidase domain-containing protein [Sulfobacillus harzensis]NMP21609.1 PASTA domain-containing protein [Sulfobacillus harzensis]
MNDRPPLMLKRRNFVAMIGFGLFDLLIGSRLVTIQTLDAPKLKKLADSIHFRSVPLAPFRGNITDRHGRLLAGSHHAFSAYAIPAQTKSRKTESILLADILDMEQSRLLRRLSRHQGFVWLKRRLTPKELATLKSQLAALPGIHLVTETARYYPEGELAAGVLGFTGIDNQGLAGLEMVYDKYLKGERGALQEEFTAYGENMPFARQRIVPSRQGDTLELSIDENIQWMAERACEHAMIATGGRAVMITVMHPKTGGVLAMAQRPTFNPNHFKDFPAKNYRELAVTDAIPPGSIFKPVTLASALEAGTTNPGAGFFCPGFKVVLGRRVNCWRPSGHGAESLADIVKNSCNVGFMELGLGMGVDRFYESVGHFGLMHRTGIDLPGEALGLFPRKARVTALDLAIMAFGQTLTVTPIGLITAISAIANGGELLKPHVARAIKTPDGQLVRSFDGQRVRRVVSSEVASLVQRMMIGVVDKGSGKLAQVPGYKVAGKTGTAQKVINGRTEKGIYIASFIGFAPVPNPAAVILISVDEPQGAFYGGQVAAPVFGRLMRDILRYMKIPPTEPIKKPRVGEAAMVPDLVDLSPEVAYQDAAVFGFPVQFKGQGKIVVDQSVTYGGYRPAGTLLTLTLGDHPRDYLQWVTVPNFRRLTVASAHQLAFELGLNTAVRHNGGHGQVVHQSISPGTQVKSGTTVVLDLA